MGHPAEKLDHKYNYGDYITWPEGERFELIDGNVYDMSPAPLRIHQEILGKLYMEFGKYFNGKECKVYLSPFDVRLPRGDEPDEEIDTVVQPDLSVICDTSKLDRRGCRGAPDLVVEIISSSSAGRDMKDKLKLYEKHGVKEYWLVFPYEQVVQLFTLERDSKFQFREGYKSDEIIESPLFTGLKVDCNEIFKDLEGEKF